MNKHEFNRNTLKRATRVLEIAAEMADKIDKAHGSYNVRNIIEQMQLHADGYADGSLTNDSGIIATGNWNTITKWNSDTKSNVEVSDLPARVGNILEKMKIECEWSDTHSTCDSCYKLIQTEPDSYSWQPNYYVSEDGITCGACIKENPSDYLEYLDGNPDACMSIDIDLKEHGYSKLNEDSFESGWFPGQNDDPRQVAKDLHDKGIEHFIFVKDENSQFYSKWSVWVLNESNQEEM